MKPIPTLLVLTSLLWTGSLTLGQTPADPAEPTAPAVVAQPSPLPDETGPPETAPAPSPGGTESAPAVEPATEVPEGMPPAEDHANDSNSAPDQTPTPQRPTADENRAPDNRDAGFVIRPARRPAPAASPASTGEKNLRLNFRGAPLDLVLDYLSEAAGYIIILETEVKGKLDVWSNQPVSQAEAVDILNQVLAKNGYAALQEGRTLTIVTKDEAKKRNTPVRTGNDPAGIPRSDQVVTQIIPVKFVNAVQLSRDLQALFPPNATIAANEGGNAIVITDTQTNIRRVAEIIKALDTAISSVSAVRVFPLRYADAKSLATVIRDLFQAQNSSRSGSGQQQVQRGFRGGPGGGGFPGMPGGGMFGGGGNQGGGQSSGSGAARVSSPAVTAVADERSNSVVVSAPEDQMPIIEDLVKQVDVNVDDITELRVFALLHADAQEMADLLAELFPDTTRSGQNNTRGQFRFGGGPGGGFAGAFGGGSSSTTSTRQQQQSRVSAVADMRTRSVVVSASRDLMPEIAQIITQLDSDPARKQKVHVFSVENTDPATVEEILRGLFETQNTRNRSTTSRSSNNRQAGSQLNNRASSNMQNMGRSSSSSRGGSSTAFGSSSAIGR